MPIRSICHAHAPLMQRQRCLQGDTHVVVKKQLLTLKWEVSLIDSTWWHIWLWKGLCWHWNRNFMLSTGLECSYSNFLIIPSIAGRTYSCKQSTKPLPRPHESPCTFLSSSEAAWAKTRRDSRRAWCLTEQSLCAEGIESRLLLLLLHRQQSPNAGGVKACPKTAYLLGRRIAP